MAPTTYCTRLDLNSIIGEAAVTACVDDDQDGDVNGVEAGYITGAIQRAANEMNEKIRYQYPTLSALATNDWCRWCNAYLACAQLFSRRGNAPPASILEEIIAYRETLMEVRWGRSQIPEQAPQYNFLPSVSNPTIEFNNPSGPVAIDTNLSTSNTPPDGVRRNNADSR